MQLAPIVARRWCRGRGISAYWLHPLLCAGAADSEAFGHAACIYWRWQALPLARHQHKPRASIGVCRSCLGQGVSAHLLHPLLFAGASDGEASSHAARIHGYPQELLMARHRCLPLASIAVCRRCRLRGIGACCLHPWLFAGAAEGEASSHTCCLQALPLTRHRVMPLASTVACRCCRLRGIRPCRLHPLLLAGGAEGVQYGGPAHLETRSCLRRAGGAGGGLKIRLPWGGCRSSGRS